MRPDLNDHRWIEIKSLEMLPGSDRNKIWWMRRDSSIIRRIKNIKVDRVHNAFLCDDEDLGSVWSAARPVGTVFRLSESKLCRSSLFIKVSKVHFKPGTAEEQYLNAVYIECGNWTRIDPYRSVVRVHGEFVVSGEGEEP